MLSRTRQLPLSAYVRATQCPVLSWGIALPGGNVSGISIGNPGQFRRWQYGHRVQLGDKRYMSYGWY
eukprot:3486957-Rhodomonas_salina.2